MAWPRPPGWARKWQGSFAAMRTTIRFLALRSPVRRSVCAADTLGRCRWLARTTKCSTGSPELTFDHLLDLRENEIGRDAQKHRDGPPLQRELVAAYQRHHGHHDRRNHHVSQPHFAHRNAERPRRLRLGFAQLPG